MAIASEAGHWYESDGTPAYETVGSNGTLRPTTLRDARKHGYVPSVSGIIKCASAEALQKWIRKRDIRFAREMPCGAEEDVENWVDRVLGASEDEGAKVRDLGSAIHTAIEKHLLDKQYDLEFKQHVAGALKCVEEWCGLDGIESEKSFAHPLGFGGKVDIHKRPLPLVIDFKSTDKALEELKTWDNHAMQLGAYRNGLGLPTAKCAIIYVSTSIPGASRLIEVSHDNLDRGWRMFKCLLSYWQEWKNYYPAKELV